MSKKQKLIPDEKNYLHLGAKNIDQNIFETKVQMTQEKEEKEKYLY